MLFRSHNVVLGVTRCQCGGAGYASLACSGDARSQSIEAAEV